MTVVSSLVTTMRRARAEHLEADLVELEPDLGGDDLGAGEDGHVLEHRLAAVTEAGRLDADRGEQAADLVDHEGRERLAVDVLGHDEQRLGAWATFSSSGSRSETELILPWWSRT